MAEYLIHDDYTIAWIAILPIEAEAALGILDKQHQASSSQCAVTIIFT